VSEALLIEVSWPAKELSPNARVHPMVKHRYAKAAKKFHFDGIAEALGINDKRFESPIVKWADKTERGKVVIAIGGVA
jgi:hypothetical protein